MTTDKIYINMDRFRSTFFKLAKIGENQCGGIHRSMFSRGYIQARKWFRKQIIESGVEFRIDGAGNHTARLDCGFADAPTLILGSHLDSVPNGGKYDGALGVIAALEVLLSIRDANLPLPVHLEAVDFTDEEGTLFGLLGSSAQSGKLKAEDIAEPRGGKDNLVNGLSQLGLTLDTLLSARREPATLAGYIELHIEQGSRLIDSKMDVGVVTGIVGINSHKINFLGRADHAGTTKMTSRLDASQGASAFTLASHTMVIERFPDSVINIGNMDFFPGAFNIVPEKVSVSVEFRSPHKYQLSQLETAILNLAVEIAENYNLGLEIENLGRHDPATMDQKIQATIIKVASGLGLESIYLASSAGHDAQSFADICPSGMIFVPSVNGASHSSREYTSWQDCINGANVLLQTTILVSNYK